MLDTCLIFECCNSIIFLTFMLEDRTNADQLQITEEESCFLLRVAISVLGNVTCGKHTVNVDLLCIACRTHPVICTSD